MLAVEYIEAVLGNGKEYFGLKVIQTLFQSYFGEKCVFYLCLRYWQFFFYPQNALHATSPSVWLPYASLDQLLVLLKDVQPDSELAKVGRLQFYHELSYSLFLPDEGSYMASSVSGQDESHPLLWLATRLAEGQDGAILLARDYPLCPATK